MGPQKDFLHGTSLYGTPLHRYSRVSYIFTPYNLHAMMYIRSIATLEKEFKRRLGARIDVGTSNMFLNTALTLPSILRCDLRARLLTSFRGRGTNSLMRVWQEGITDEGWSDSYA